MKRFSQYAFEISDVSHMSFWKKAGPMDRVYIGYGMLVVLLVIISYVLGTTGNLPYDPQEINLELIMAPPGAEGHLLGTDFMGRDMLSRLIISIQAYFLPGLLAIGIAILFGTFFLGFWPATGGASSMWPPPTSATC